ncbi:MAG: protein-L-isoaspartate(D-aspartate) O-methyltransferase [Ectothiorhodospiraceae bacterium AqS1]|nr:protein-L-isoaspartate(D-aspartate) O-methyltransferase [Ectothiorhodospiraceae bacterium AqS1]
MALRSGDPLIGDSNDPRTRDRIKGVGMTSMRTRRRLIDRLRAKGIDNERVLEAMRLVPRHLFVDEALASRSYEDIPLPIGRGQTISQPLIVAMMTQAVLRDSPARILEIGTGCGYQTAILASLFDRVFSVERIESLLFRAQERLGSLGFSNIYFRHGDGNEGWPELAPFDAVLVTAAPEKVPPKLIEQLAPEGRLVIPVGEARGQKLMRLTRYRTGKGVQEEVLDRVTFVPMLAGIR